MATKATKAIAAAVKATAANAAAGRDVEDNAAKDAVNQDHLDDDDDEDDSQQSEDGSDTEPGKADGLDADADGDDAAALEAKEAAAAASRARIQQARSKLIRSLKAWDQRRSKASTATVAKKLAFDIGAIFQPSVATIKAPATCTHGKAAGKDDHTRLVDTTMKTDNGRIHMLLAISQGLLNNRLKYLWALSENMRSINLSLPSGEAMHAFLLAPKIHLEVEADRPGAAVYWLNFDYGGHITVRDDEAEGGFRTVSTDDWKFAFDVDMTLADVETSSDEYQEIKGKLSAPGDFRISRLVADLESAAITSPRMDLCSFGAAKPDEPLLQSVKTVLDSWRVDAVENGAGVMGWTATASSPTSLAGLPPTFTPTAQQLQTYPYMAAGQDKPAVGLDDPRANYNMLLYLSMANNTAFPADRFLDYSGNWCTPDNPVQPPRPREVPATLCIGRDIFFDSFILPHLRQLNRASWVMAKTPSIEFTAVNARVRWNKEYGGKPESFYGEWVPVISGPIDRPDWIGWDWNKSSSASHSRKPKARNLRVTATMTTTVRNRIRIPPQGNTIFVDHSSTVELLTKQKRIKTRTGRVKVRRTGTIQIHIESVKDGQNMRLRFPTPDDLFKTEITELSSDFLTDQKRDTVEREAKSFLDQLKNSKDFKSAVANVQAALQNVGAFVVPTGGTFFLRDPLFNDEGDLVLKAAYDG
ncbi:hypothetical protein B0T14DRAFT_508336 [Immersiella caudata]|uniref:Uncharacterized protein n=1 Tax=Immersiella caudata TaxID=314043 RepID=A0AA40CCT0_9PEZI|nr:hypothetical protein B0T14DRAFT_508336 [Immersiella caudata]